VVRVRRRNWWKQGFASLRDRPRSGVPSKLSDQHRTALKDWASNEPLSCRELLTRLKTEYGVTVCATTLRNELKKMLLCGNAPVIV
jgi:transposase